MRSKRQVRDFVERVWFGDDLVARAARVVLAPTEAVYRLAVGVRETLFDAGVFASQDPALPTLSVGNVSVGGTGKTPIAAWIAAELVNRAARPAIVLRGYGEDEPLVHSRLNPSVPVIVSSDRAAGVAAARAAGASVAVLDDAFQHRQVSRAADLVLVSADRWSRSHHLLPAGPLREPLAALRRATIIVVTCKAANDAAVDSVNESLAEIAPRVPRTTVRLEPSELRDAAGAAGPASARALSE